MQDVELIPDSNGIFDIVIGNDRIGSVTGFQTSIEVSLFTDARAPESLVTDAINRRGWVGNIRTAVDGREIGSTLWLLDQARLTSRTISQAEIYANNGLLWFVEDSIVSEIKLDISRGRRKISIDIDIIISDNIIERYNVLWRRTSVSGLSNI